VATNPQTKPVDLGCESAKYKWIFLFTYNEYVFTNNSEKKVAESKLSMSRLELCAFLIIILTSDLNMVQLMLLPPQLTLGSFFNCSRRDAAKQMSVW